MGYHQIDSDIHLPTNPNLLSRVLTGEQLITIYDLVGSQELSRIASVTHGESAHPDYHALAAQEKADLTILCGAISQVTGKSQPWIIGFASEFARALLAIHQDQAD